MQASFWHQKWEQGDIGFHEAKPNTFLVAHFEKLKLPKGSRVFLPLCGKTRDFAWLLACGYRVVGAELSELAIIELFKELDLKADVSQAGELMLYRANDIDIFVGDIFKVSAEILGPVNAIYDRAALVALPADLRERYTAQLMRITDIAPQLLITYEYNQSLIAGPPFSITADEAMQHYAGIYRLQPVESRSVEGGLKGKVASTETAWLLQKSDN